MYSLPSARLCTPSSAHTSIPRALLARSIQPARACLTRGPVRPQGVARGGKMQRGVASDVRTLVLGRDGNVLVLLAEALALPVGREPVHAHAHHAHVRARRTETLCWG